MRFYNTQHAFYCGIDLHARSMFTHILDPYNTTIDKAQTDYNATSAKLEVTFTKAKATAQKDYDRSLNQALTARTNTITKKIARLFV